MDNNNFSPENGENKRYKNNHRRRPSKKPRSHDQSELTQNGSITVKPGRYDLPPEAEAFDSGAELEQAKTSETYSGEKNQKSRHQGDKKRRQRNRRRGSRELREDREQLELEEKLDELDAGASVSEYIAVTSPSEGDIPEEEIIEELNSAESLDEVPGIEADDENSYEAPSEPEPLETYEIIGVRFKSTGKIYYFDPDGHRFKREDSVIVDTARGLEFGTVDIGNRMVTEREVVLPLRKVVRRATADDIERSNANAARAAEAFAICGEKIIEHKLEMKLVDVEYTFDNSKLLFYFTADGRVDFRELVKDLAGVFRTRIELRQIGIRDETKLLGGIGICGRPFCCKTFLSDFVQVSIKMAKEQNLSLNSAKISGACGRLMCCLRYEYDVYSEEIKKTPKVDQIVTTPDGEGIVTEVQPLAGICRVKFTERQDMPPKLYHRDLLTVIGGKGVKKSHPAQPRGEKVKDEPSIESDIIDDEPLELDIEPSDNED